jgi:hypothetical protein
MQEEIQIIRSSALWHSLNQKVLGRRLDDELDHMVQAFSARCEANGWTYEQLSDGQTIRVIA